MSEHFGNVSPTQAYIKKLQGLGIALITINFVLIVGGIAVFVYYSNRPAQPVNIAENQAPKAATPAPQFASLEVLVAKSRIEQGVSITNDMLATTFVAEANTSGDVLRPSDKVDVLGKYARNVIHAGFPVKSFNLTKTPPTQFFTIPEGHRAITITIDNRTGVEGFARPNSRVDVLWYYTDEDGSDRLATIVRFAKVLSVGGVTSAERKSAAATKSKSGATKTATLLLKEKDAKMVELARNMGRLSLALIGEEDNGEEFSEDAGFVTVKDIMNRVRGHDGEEGPLDGFVTVVDPKSGKTEKFVLSDNQWERKDEQETRTKITSRLKNTAKPKRARLSDKESNHQQYRISTKPAAADDAARARLQ